MKNIDMLHENILLNVAERYPYTLKEISRVFLRCNSVDDTIEIIELATRSHVSLNYLIEQRELTKEEEIKKATS